MNNKNTGRKAATLKLLALTSTALVGLSMPVTAMAQDWAGGTSTNWFDATNWTPGQVPTAGSNVKINVNSGSDPIIFGVGNDAVANQIVVGDSNPNGVSLLIESGGTLTSSSGIVGNLAGATGSVDVGGFPSAAISKWTNSGDLIIGNVGSGLLNINKGVVTNADGTIGAQAGSFGLVGVSGPSAVWTNNGFLTVGNVGAGTLNITNGGSVSDTYGLVGYLPGSTGAVTVGGVGSTWTSSSDLLVGVNGVGTLAVSNGGKVVNLSGVIGGSSSATGTVTVEGPGSTWVNNLDLYVGDSGSGTLTVSNGGKVSNLGIGRIGSTIGATGKVTVDGVGSTWTNTSHLTVGASGSGALAISGGGAVSNTAGVIGGAAASIGTVAVTGIGSTWINSGNLNVGEYGAGTMNVSAGGVASNVDATLGYDSGASGTVKVDGTGSNWTNGGATLIGVSGTGWLDITNGGRVDSGVTVAGAKAIIGSAAGSTGLAFVEDAGSTWNVVNDLVVGESGSGTLVIARNGKVSVGGTLILAQNAGSSGALDIGGNLAPGTLDATNVQFGAGAGSIRFNHTSTNYNFDAAISGLGTINQWKGTTHLTADSSGFTGQTHITGGSLLVDGKLGTGAVDVQSGGTLGGKGSIGGSVTVASGGILSGVQGQTLTMQSLNLDSGANVNVTLSSPGGAALFHVANNLTLDGTLNITSGGAFGPGVYSLMTYGGALTDNGLDIGSTPFGSTAADFGVQTSVAGQVNLISNALPNLAFWDGDGAVNANNNIVDGGSGVWTAASTNWTDMNGSTNGVLHPQPTFVIFQGTAGTVTVDASAGSISVTGMQFASDGYQITGAPITLADPNSIIRVGDGSAAGANYKATIGSVLTGSGGLNKTDLGALILTADNNYTGGTTITGGTLQLGNGGTSGSVTGNIVNNGTLTFNRSDVATFAGAISGNGTIQQNGTGTINLTGQSTGFGGTVLVNAGTLGVNNGGVLNSSNVYTALNVDSTATVAVDGAGSSLNSTGDLAIGASGAGTLTIANGGKVSDSIAFLGANVGSTGTATVSGAGSAWTSSTGLFVGLDGTGTLNILNGGAVSSALANVGNGAGSQGTVVVDGAGSTFANTGNLFVGLGGTGALAISNGGTVGNQIGTIGEYAGSSGTVAVGGSGSTWANSGNLIVGNKGTASLTIADSGVVSTGGGVLLAGQAGSTGTLNIGAAAGSAAKGAGTLNAGTLQFGQGTGTLNFNHTDTNYSFASNMLGAGTINQLAGNTNLTGNSSGFTGNVTVKGGRLAVNGQLDGGQVTVFNSAMLGGNGKIGSLTANAGSIIAPGNSIGTLNVAGNASFAAGSTYQVDLANAGQSDLLKIGGTATLANGALLTVTKANSAPHALGTHYTVLAATGGLTGTFSFNNVQLTNFMGLVGGADANNYYLDVTKTKTFASAGLTPNQIVTAGAIDGLPISSTLTTAIANLSSDAVAQYAFDQLSGEVHSSVKTATIEDSRFLRSAVNDRLRAAFGGVGASGGNTVTYDGGKPRPVDATTDGGAVWGQAFGSWGHWNSDGNAAKFDRSIGGFFMGADAPAFDTWRFGAVAGYSRSSFDVKDRHSSGTSDNYSVGLYGGTQWGDLAFRTGAAYTISDISTSRRVNFAGFGDSLSGDYRAGTAQVFGELSYKMQAGNVALEPFANLAYVNLRTDGFSEKGGAALTSQSTNTATTFTTLGLRASTSFDLNGMAVTAKGMVGWRHAFGDTTPNSVMSFAGSAPFNIGGVPIARNAAVVDLGLDMNLSANTTLGVSYGGQFGSGVTDQTLRANFSVKF